MKRTVALFVTIVSLALGIFHLYAGGIQIFPAMQQRGLHWGLVMALVFLIYPLKKKKEAKEEGTHILLDFGKIVIAIISLYIAYYIFTNFIELTTVYLNPSTLVLVIATIMIIVTLEAARRVIGWALPVLSVLFLVYAFYGQHLPLIFSHSGYSFERIVTQIALTDEGILGITLGISATYVILFVIFGTFLEGSGAGKLFIDLAFKLVGKLRGGPAKISVVASAFFGSISGSHVSNVVTTGVLTIPLMKRAGYRPAYAGAVESVASTGGMILPPVMGAASFLVADFLQIEYYKVALAALIPALLYFLAVFIMVDLRAARIEKERAVDTKSDEDVEESIGELLRKRGHLLLPLFLLIYLLLIEQVSPARAGFWATISIPVFAFLRKETRMSFGKMKASLENGVKLSLIVATACASAGIVIGVVNMTGLALRFSGMLISLSGENLFLLLVLTMLTSIVLGMGLPAVAAYIILAILVAPAITQLGVSPLAAHLFIFYYGTLSGITPPVAIAVFAASGIARSDPMKTAINAVKLASVAFIIPFMFVYGPALILEASAIQIIWSTITATIGVFALGIALEGFLFVQVSWINRILFISSALCLMSVGYVFDIIGLIVLIGVFLYEYRKKSNATQLSELS